MEDGWRFGGGFKALYNTTASYQSEQHKDISLVWWRMEVVNEKK
jgi:hypothetical protein